MNADLNDEPQAAWDVAKGSADVLKDALEKEELIKEIMAAQEDLRALNVRVQSVQKDIEKLTSGNATLQIYIDNLTMQIAKRRQ